MRPKAISRLRPDSLLRDIAAVDKRLRAALDDPRRIDRVRGLWGANSPYEDFTPKLAPLFERARQAFEQGQMVLARDAYAALFAVLALKDGYGFGVSRPASVVVRAEQARYLRAVGEVAPAGQRGMQFLQTMHHLKQSLWEGCDLTIGEVLEAAPMDPAEQGAWLDDLIRVLGQDRERDADRLLREAVKSRRGADGLVELARRDSPWRPRAWLDWLEMVAAQHDPAGLLAAAKEALANIPEHLELRAVAADHLAAAATALGDAESLLTARWEAFRAEPFPVRLLDLRDAVRDGGQPGLWIRRAVDLACDDTGGLIPGPLVGGGGGNHEVLFTQDRDCFTSGPTDGTVACALLLTGDWRKALKLARDDASPSWSSASTALGLLLPVMLAWLAGWPKQAMPVNVASLFEAALRLVDNPNDPGAPHSHRLRAALTEAVADWKPPPEAGKATALNSCIRLARDGLSAPLSRHDGDKGDLRAVLAAAVAEVRALLG